MCCLFSLFACLFVKCIDKAEPNPLNHCMSLVKLLLLILLLILLLFVLHVRLIEEEFVSIIIFWFDLGDVNISTNFCT